MSLDLNTLATSWPVNHGPLDLCNAINAWFRGSDVGVISSAVNAEKGNCLAANGGGRSTNLMPSAHKSRVLRKRAKRNETVYNYAIALACDRFFRSRGIPAGMRENFNKGNTTEEPRTDELPLRD